MCECSRERGQFRVSVNQTSMPDIPGTPLFSMSRWPVYCGGVFLVTLLCVNIYFYPPFKNDPETRGCSQTKPEFAMELDVAEQNGTFVRTKDNTTYGRGTFWEQNGTTYGCFGENKKPYIRKCCGEHRIFNKAGICVTSKFNNTIEVFRNNIRVHNKTTFMNFIMRVKTSPNHFRVLPSCPAHKILSIRNLNRVLFVFDDGKVWNKFFNNFFDQSRYCLDILDTDTKAVQLAIAMCRATMEEAKSDRAMYSHQATLRRTLQTACYVLYLISFAVFAIQPTIRRGYGRWLMCYLTARFLKAVNILNYYHISTYYPKMCIVIVTIIQYSELASQVWHVVIFYHIWIALRPDYVSNLGPACIYNNKRFMFFSAVAWGGPVVVLVGVTALVIVAGAYHQDVHQLHCWGDNRAVRHIYLTVPHMVTDLVILLMCIDILRKIDDYCCDAATLPPNNVRHYSAKEIEWSSTYVKVSIMTSCYLLLMSVLMLVDRVFHVVDFLYYTADALDCMRGLEVFLIFVCRRELLESLWEKMHDGWLHLSRRLQQRRESGLSLTGYIRERFEFS